MLSIVTSDVPPGMSPAGVSTMRARVGGALPDALSVTWLVNVKVSPQFTLFGVNPIAVPTSEAGNCGVMVTACVSSPIPIA